MAMKFGYARVSTRDQNLQLQIDDLKKEGCIVGIIFDWSITTYVAIAKHFILISFFLTLLLYRYILTKIPVIDIWTVSRGFLEALLCSYLFYFIVVFIPQKRRTKHIKKVTLMAYADFKREILNHLTLMSDQYTGDVEPLFEPPVFKQYFSKGKWYQVANALSNNKQFMHRWRLKALFLRDEIIFLLNTVEHSNNQSFTSLKVLCWNLQELESINLTEEYEDQKSLVRFFWQIFAGWCFISGYVEYDYIKKAITQL